MAEPREFLIVQNLQTALRAISIADGYHHDVASVAVKLDPNAQVEDLLGAEQQRPFAIIEFDVDSWEYQPANRIALTLPITIHFVNDVDDVTQDDGWLKELTRLWADVEQAIAQDITRAGKATDTRIVTRDFRTFEGAQVWAIVKTRIAINRVYGAPNA